MNFGFQMSIIFRKIFHDFPKFFDKIFNPQNQKNIKISIIFWQVQIDKIENKMSKIITKKNSKPKNFEKKIISHINMFLTGLLEFSRNRW